MRVECYTVQSSKQVSGGRASVEMVRVILFQSSRLLNLGFLAGIASVSHFLNFSISSLSRCVRWTNEINIDLQPESNLQPKVADDCHGHRLQSK